MKPVEFDGCNVTFAKDQPPYLPLPAQILGDYVVTVWKMSWLERLKVLLRGRICLTMVTYGRPLQPVLLTVDTGLVTALEEVS